MSLLTPSLGVAADVLDLAAELAGALRIATERLVIAALDDGHEGVVSDNGVSREAVAPAPVAKTVCRWPIAPRYDSPEHLSPP